MFVKARSLVHAAVASAAALFAIIPGCGGDGPGISGNSNTNWLQSCDSDAECGKGLSCLCGVCTLECRTQAQCASLGESAMCLSNATLSSACMVNGLCTRSATLPDGSLATGGSSGMGAGGRGNGGMNVGGFANTGANAGGSGNTGASGAGGASAGGKAGAAGAPPDASSGGLDAGPRPDAGPDASPGDGGQQTCLGQICRCASGAYCGGPTALCIEPDAPCPADNRVPACTPSCGAGTVCVRHQTVGGALFQPDAGRCDPPRLIVPEAPFSCSFPASFGCEPVPAACTGVVSCACVGLSFCGSGECVDNVAGQLDCILRVP
jgi:hypothetical protein